MKDTYKSEVVGAVMIAALPFMLIFAGGCRFGSEHQRDDKDASVTFLERISKVRLINVLGNRIEERVFDRGLQFSIYSVTPVSFPEYAREALGSGAVKIRFLIENVADEPVVIDDISVYMPMGKYSGADQRNLPTKYYKSIKYALFAGKKVYVIQPRTSLVMPGFSVSVSDLDAAKRWSLRNNALTFDLRIHIKRGDSPVATAIHYPSLFELFDQGREEARVFQNLGNKELVAMKEKDAMFLEDRAD